MKVLQINSVFPNGSTGKIVHDIHSILIADHEQSVVCYGYGEKTRDANVYRMQKKLYGKLQAVITRITGLMYDGCICSTTKLIWRIKKENPDIVHLHCINGHFVNIYRLITWLKKNHINTVLTLHAEFIYTANCGYALECERWRTGCGHCPRWKKETKSWFVDNTALSWQKMKRAFDGFNHLIVASVSPWLMERARLSPILFDKKHCVVLNGLDINVFHIYSTDDVREKMGLTNTKIIFHATPNFNNDPENIKGGYYLLRLAEAMRDQNVKFLVAGCYDSSIAIPDNVLLLGRILDQKELAKYYSMADITLLTSQKETFSMVTAESLCCGTPVVGFKSGAPEQITLKNFSSFVEHGDIVALKREVCRWLDMEKDKQTISKKATEKYSSEKMVREYYSLYSELYSTQ